MTNDVVIIGAGQAAAQLAVSLRLGAFTGGIRMIGDESYPPYQRPPLSKKFLSERAGPESLFLRPLSYWRDHDVTIDLGTAAAAIDLRNRRITLADGRDLSYGTLVLATGARARALPLPGVDLAGVFTLRGIDDVHRLRAALDDGRRVVIIGGGYIGLEIAASVRSEGRDVIVVEAEDRLLKRVAGPTVASFFERFHRERGVDVRLDQRVVAVEGAGRASAVRLSGGEALEADLILVAAGARPNEELAAAAALLCDDGILVDEFARASAPNIYAVGDCTRFPSGLYGRRVRLESVQNAVDQAKAAAASILGKPAPYNAVPWFWSEQYELKLQIAGLLEGHDASEVAGDPLTARFSVAYRRAGRLIALDAVNDARAYMSARRSIAEEAQPEPSAAR